MSADIFLKPDEAVPFFEALILAFNRYGSREKRTRSRLFHMIEDIGMEGLKRKISEFYEKPWVQEGELLLQKRDFEDFEELADGSFGYRYRTDYGVVGPEEFEAIAAFVKESGAEVRLGIDQQIYILGLRNREVPFERRDTAPTVVACAGSEYCPFSYWSIKDESHMLPQKEIGECGVIVGFSGCLKGCGRHKHADIGIVGLRSSRFGRDDRSARIFLGAEYTSGRRAAEAVFQSVPLSEMGRVVSLVLKEFRESGCATFEEFSAKVMNRFEPEFLNLWFMAKLESGSDAKLRADMDGMELLMRNFEDKEYLDIAREKGFSEAAAYIVKDMWYEQEAPQVHHVKPSERRSR